MDRFIVTKLVAGKSYIQNLKSNMDRFIAPALPAPADYPKYLKSNMDRFIVLKKNKAKGT